MSFPGSMCKVVAIDNQPLMVVPAKEKQKKQPSTINLDGQHLWQRKNKKQPQSTKNETYHNQQFPSVSIMNFQLATISVSCCDFELPVNALITPYMIKMKSKRGITGPE